MPNAPVPTLEHFRLLQNFGRHKLYKEKPERREQMWQLLCNGAHLPYIPHPDVVKAWMAFVAGDSTHTNLAINGEIHPSHVLVGVLYDGRLAASHTTKTASLLRKIVSIYRNCFKTDAEFLSAMQELCESILHPKSEDGGGR